MAINQSVKIVSFLALGVPTAFLFGQSRPDFKKAEQAFTQARRFEAANQPSKAFDSYSVAIRLAPEFASAYRHRGRLRTQFGQNGERLSDLNNAIRLQNDDAESYQLRGDLLLKM